MKPKAPVRQAQRELFRVELDLLIDPAHALVKLGRQINWAGFDELLGKTYASANGAPGARTRLQDFKIKVPAGRSLSTNPAPFAMPRAVPALSNRPAKTGAQAPAKKRTSKKMRSGFNRAGVYQYTYRSVAVPLWPVKLSRYS